MDSIETGILNGMWTEETSEYGDIRRAELSLLSNEVRENPELLQAVLDSDYAEIGRSGRRWTYDDEIELLPSQIPLPSPVTDEWRYRRLSPTLVLVNYRLVCAGRVSRHSSIWQIGEQRPVLLFHQGTDVRNS